jgi:hypothetical protein
MCQYLVGTKKNIYLISIVAIVIALSLVIRASLDPPIPTEPIIWILVVIGLVGALYFYPYVKELIDKNTIDP